MVFCSVRDSFSVLFDSNTNTNESLRAKRTEHEPNSFKRTLNEPNSNEATKIFEE